MQVSIARALAALLLVVVAVLNAADAKCGALLKGIDFSGRQAGKYSTQLAQKDFGKWKFIRNASTASITRHSGRTYLAMLMKKGCYATSLSRGCGMYGRVPIRGVTSATIEYTMRFGKGFDWNRGGKLLGLCGGSCTTGCKPASAQSGWSSRIMWTDHECRGRGPCRKGDGGLHLYNYYENMAKNKKCGEELTYTSAGNRNLVIKADKDYRLRVVVKLNKPGRADGYMKAYLDGKQVAAKAGMKIIARSSQKIEHVMMDSFFGGGSEAFAAKRNEYLMFKDIYVWEGDCGATSGNRRKL